MKFKCGKTLAEQKAAEAKEKVAEAARREWHSWFAWHPVNVAPGVCVWLEVVNRKRISYESWVDCSPETVEEWEYAPA
jgi:hypothetical protein